MKAFRFFLCFLLLAGFTAACRPASPLVPQPGTASMKGYELYSWEEDGQWFFAVLVGTNREKTLAEIQSPAAALAGIDELRSVLETIPSGQFVTWLSRDGLAFPPEDVIREVEGICREVGLECNLAP